MFVCMLVCLYVGLCCFVGCVLRAVLLFVYLEEQHSAATYPFIVAKHKRPLFWLHNQIKILYFFNNDCGCSCFKYFDFLYL